MRFVSVPDPDFKSKNEEDFKKIKWHVNKKDNLLMILLCRYIVFVTNPKITTATIKY